MGKSLQYYPQKQYIDWCIQSLHLNPNILEMGNEIVIPHPSRSYRDRDYMNVSTILNVDLGNRQEDWAKLFKKLGI